jgi:hypothetical protein
MYNGGVTAMAGGPGAGGPGYGFGQTAPFGPANIPWYQMLFVPWYGGFGQGSLNPSAPYMGNTFYNNYSALRNPRRWRPTGELRNMN